MLAYLLGVRAAADLKVIRVAIGYSDRALRTAAEEMALAGFIERIDGFPVTYRADTAGWARILQLYQLDVSAPAAPAIPPWDYWSPLFAFYSAARAWAATAEEVGWSPYVTSSRARDLLTEFATFLSFTGVPVGNIGQVKGTAFLGSFQQVVRHVLSWSTEHLHHASAA